MNIYKSDCLIQAWYNFHRHNLIKIFSIPVTLRSWFNARVAGNGGRVTTDFTIFKSIDQLWQKVSGNGLIDHQKSRNQFLKKEIALLDAQITEIKELEDQKKRLLDRMAIIETLQRGRPEVVHLFDELARTLPDGVHLNSVKQSGKRITLTGVAESSTRVSAYMRNIDNSDWLADPGLNVVETVQRDRSRKSEFTIFAKQVSPVATPEEAQ